MRDDLEYHEACYCAGTGCGGHVKLMKLDINWTENWATIGWQGPAQHTYTPNCAGHHGPGPCHVRS